MKTYSLYKKQILKASLDEVWDFFSSPENLDTLTPPNMGFEILTEKPLPRMHQGQIIEYKVRPVLNVPLFWRTEITEVKPLEYFVDEQLKGPYSLWRHRHIFTETPEGVLMEDKLDYALPMSFLGQIAHSAYVKARLKEIFDYRFEIVDQIFN